MSEKRETIYTRATDSEAPKIRWSRIAIGCLLGIAFAVGLGVLRYFNAFDTKDMGIAFGLSIAEFVVCVAAAIFVEHRRLSRLNWRQQAVQYDRRRLAMTEADRWKDEVQSDLILTESEITKFRKFVDLCVLRCGSIEELKQVAKKAVLDGYSGGMASVRKIERTGERK